MESEAPLEGPGLEDGDRMGDVRGLLGSGKSETWGHPGAWLLGTQTQSGIKKRDVSSPGGSKADSGGKGAGGQGAVWASWDSHLDPCRCLEVWRNMELVLLEHPSPCLRLLLPPWDRRKKA